MIPRLPALGLALSLALPAQALDLKNLSDEDRVLLGAEIRAYLLENPEVIFEAAEIYEQRKQAAQATADLALVASNAEEIFSDGYSWVGGNPEGDITLVEFLDYRCGYCRRAHDEVAKLLEFDGNIRMIVKEFPILGEQSVLASRFAVATKQVAGDDAYKAVSDALMTLSADVTPRSLRRIAETLQLDYDAIAARMDDESITEEIRRTRDLALKLNISGTPTFVLQDELLRGYLPFDQLQAIIDEKRG